MTPPDLPEVLAALADVCRRSEQCFGEWARQARSDDLHALLLRRVEERAAAAAELQRHVAWLRGAVEGAVSQADTGPATPLARRRATPASMPVSLLAPVAAAAPCRRRVPPADASAEGDVALLADCEACEAKAIDAYWHALQAPLPRRLRLVLQNQYAAVKRSHRRALVLRYLALGRLDADAAPDAEAGATASSGSVSPPSREASHPG